MGVIASAPSKVILFGEHFVVFGEPAIVLAIDRRVYARSELCDDGQIHLRSVNLNLAATFSNDIFKVEKGDQKEARIRFEPVKFAIDRILEKRGKKTGLNIEINSTVPVGAGLGSSAAVIAAVTTSVAKLLNIDLSKEDVYRITVGGEELVHGTASGIDPAIATFGGTLQFQADTGFKPLEVKSQIPLVIGDTGIQRSTRIQVERVRDLREKYASVIEHMMLAAREITLLATEALRTDDLETVGELMNVNHALLYGVGVSDESLEWLINAARKAGALGAKLTGAGGGGCMIALSKSDKLQNVMEGIQRAGGSPFIARKTDEGVKIEHG